MKITKLLLTALMLVVLLISCGGNGTTPTKEKAEFMCEKDCEKGKVYDVAGKCPVCNGDLADRHSAEEHKHEHKHGEDGHGEDGHKDHQH